MPRRRRPKRGPDLDLLWDLSEQLDLWLVFIELQWDLDLEDLLEEHECFLDEWWLEHLLDFLLLQL